MVFWAALLSSLRRKVMPLNNPESFEEVKTRLDEIVEAVSSDTIPLEDALKLYEEAVDLGLVASSLLEENLAENDAHYQEENEVQKDSAESE
jgi:exodeoxyribonuclease VII small subunit